MHGPAGSANPSALAPSSGFEGRCLYLRACGCEESPHLRVLDVESARSGTARARYSLGSLQLQREAEQPVERAHEIAATPIR